MRSRTVQGTVAIAATASLALAACGGAGGPQSGGSSKLTDDKVVIGLLNDQSGVYKDLSGPNSKVAIQMAIDDYKAKYGDKAVAKNIEVVTADHQNKADIANTKAQEMYDRQKADVILDVPNSAAALAVATQAKNKKKLYINIGAGTTALTGDSCNKYTFHWAYDTGRAGAAAPPARHQGRRQELEHRLPRLRLRPGHEQVVHRRGHEGRRHGRPVDRLAVPERQLRHLHHQGRRGQPQGHRLDARRRRPHQLRQAVQPEPAQGQGRSWRSA